MMSTEAFLHMSPLSELSFTISTGTSTSNSVLHLKNTHFSRISFKIKTTAPDAYLVRPTLGVLEPLQSQAVIITLRTQHVGGIEKHKFSIQSRETTLEASDTQAITALWADKGREGVQQVILRAVATTAEEPKTPLSASISSVPSTASSETRPVDAKAQWAEIARTHMSASVSPFPSTANSDSRPSEAKPQWAELVRSNVCTTQQALQTEKSELEVRLRSLRRTADSKSEDSASFTTFQLLLVLLLGVVLGTALLS